MSAVQLTVVKAGFGYRQLWSFHTLDPYGPKIFSGHLVIPASRIDAIRDFLEYVLGPFLRGVYPELYKAEGAVQKYTVFTLAVVCLMDVEILVASAADGAKEELVEIAAEEVPLAEMPEGTLAIVNLISAIGTVFLSLVMLFTGRNRKAISAVSILPAAGAVVAIIMTYDMSGAMAMTDKWTAAMIAIAAVNVVLLMIRGGRKETAKAER